VQQVEHAGLVQVEQPFEHTSQVFYYEFSKNPEGQVDSQDYSLVKNFPSLHYMQSVLVFPSHFTQLKWHFPHTFRFESS